MGRGRGRGCVFSFQLSGFIALLVLGTSLSRAWLLASFVRRAAHYENLTLRQQFLFDK